VRAALACALLAVLNCVACTTASLTKTPPPAPPTVPASSVQLAASIAEAAQQLEHEADAQARAARVAAAQRDAAMCMQQDPQAVACLYGSAVALGLEAKEHPTRAPKILADMLERLARAEAADPSYDNAGPARVQALVLIRAPGWPLGPGDVERGLSAARRAATLRPEYPPNLLALAEAQEKTGAANDARASYHLARDVAGKLPESAARAEWLREAERGLSSP
jgi:hypothetical protein